MKSIVKLLKQFIREEVWRAVSRSAGLVGGMNIGKHSGETTTPIPYLGSDEDEEEKEESNESGRNEYEHINGQRRQNGNGRPR